MLPMSTNDTMEHATKRIKELRDKIQLLEEEVHQYNEKYHISKKTIDNIQQTVDAAHVKTQFLQNKVEILEKCMVKHSTINRPITNNGERILAVLVCDDAPLNCDFEIVLDMLFKHTDNTTNLQSALYRFKGHFVLEIKTLGGAVMHRISLFREKPGGVNAKGNIVYNIGSWFGPVKDRSGSDTSCELFEPIPTKDLQGLSFIATIRELYKTDMITRNGETAEINMTTL